MVMGESLIQAVMGGIHRWAQKTALIANPQKPK
jgi:hypothetical protein